MTLNDVKNALLTISQEVYHHTAGLEPDFPYIVWAEDMQSGSLHGDGKMKAQTIQGTIDLYSKKVNDPLFDQIQIALNDAGIGFSLNSTQYEEDKEIAHNEWVWNITRSVE